MIWTEVQSPDANQIELAYDPDTEECHLDVPLDHDPTRLQMILVALDAVGLEVMDEVECPSDVLPDGTIRSYLASKDGSGTWLQS